MFYAFDYTVTSNDIETAKYSMDMILSAGVIHQVDILFQKDCAHKVNVQIFHGGHQAWPSNRGKSFRGDSTVISFREFFELAPGASILTAKLWTTDTDVLKEVIIEIGVLPKRILQPLSFDELLAAATGIR